MIDSSHMVDDMNIGELPEGAKVQERKLKPIRPRRITANSPRVV